MALRRLPERQREVLVLRYYADLSEADIADAIGISRGAVKSHASRGMAALRTTLEACMSPPAIERHDRRPARDAAAPSPQHGGQHGQPLG